MHGDHKLELYLTVLKIHLTVLNVSPFSLDN